MSARLAILCPGQGGQHAGMFDLFKDDPIVDPATLPLRLLQDGGLDTVLGQTVASALADDKALFCNRLAQPLVVAATLSAWERLKSLHPALPQPALVAGYSVGELAAYAVAGALPAEQTLVLAGQRAAAMDACAAGQPQAMMSVSGMEVRAGQAVLEAHGAYLAIETGFDTAIAGGTRAALEASQQALSASGARTGWLPVAVASHTPLMQAAARAFDARLALAALTDPAMPVLAGVSGQPVRDRMQAHTALLRQMTEPLRWDLCMDALAENGIGVALELGPGAALSRMLRLRQPSIACRSVAEFRSMQGVLQWLERALDA